MKKPPHAHGPHNFKFHKEEGFGREEVMRARARGRRPDFEAPGLGLAKGKRAHNPNIWKVRQEGGELTMSMVNETTMVRRPSQRLNPRAARQRRFMPRDEFDFSDIF